MRTAVVIPTRYEPGRLGTLLDVIRPDCTEILVLDNGHEPLIEGAVDTRGLGIYQQWNRGWDLTSGFDAVAFLNDDIRVLPGSISLLTDALHSDSTLGVVYPDKYVSLSDGLPRQMELDIVRIPEWHRTLTGFAFLARRSMFSEAPFDEAFHWWCGDDAFDRDVRRAGYGVARVIGLPIEHDSDSERDGWARRPELRKLAQQDAARWASMVPA